MLSQNGASTEPTQGPPSGVGGGFGFGGTFGHQAADSVTFTSDLGTAVVVNQSDTGDLGSILLNADNGDGVTGNTFEHLVGTGLGFTNSFDLQLTDLTANQAITTQGFNFSVVPPAVAAIPEPSSLAFLGLGAIGLVARRRR